MPVLVTVGIPAEGIGIIFGVDRLLDMCRSPADGHVCRPKARLARAADAQRLAV